jgi:peptidyl-prolyl cis-trans isomerase SurA
MKKNILKFFLAIIGIIILSTSVAQNSGDKILMTIGGEKITETEFLNIYRKNNFNNDVIDKKSLEEYLELFINFKLKVKEAEELGLDTVTTFKDELKGYRNQLAQPYLTDNAMDEKLLLQAFERKQFDLRASHILIKVNENASPKDTLAAFQSIMKISKEIMNGADFSEMAVTYSEDPSAKDRPATSRRPYMKGNKGDLGYFTVFDMVYPFENGAYNTAVGKISIPVRTTYGYHLIEVTDKKKALGNVLVAHILILFPKNATHQDSLKAETKVKKAYDELTSGTKFADVVRKYSDDKGTIEKEGMLPWFGVNRMIPEFIMEISALSDTGEVTKPFLTNYGWHIVKLVEKKGLPSFEEDIPELKGRIVRSDRSKESQKSFIRQSKTEYDFTEYKENLEEIYSLVNDTIFKAKWHPENTNQSDKPLFQLDGNDYFQKDFIAYLEKTQSVTPSEDIKVFVNKKFNSFIDASIIAYEDSQLEKKYPEFRTLVKEYRDGILLFELTDQKVWSKAINDSIGLAEFYNTHKNNYMWDERLNTSIYTFSNPAYVKQARKMARKGLNKNDILDAINPDSVIYLTIIDDKCEKGDNQIIDKINWKKGITDNFEVDGQIVFVDVHEVLSPQPKLLSEARGIITADYQNFLEKEWIKELRMKYPVDVNQDVFSKIK